MKKIIAYYLSIGFVLNFIWEISQSGFYEPHFQGVADFIVVHLRATIGDVVMMLIIFAIPSLFYRKWNWIAERKISSYIIVALLGLTFAIIVEKYAILTGRWAYNELMPIISIINVGVTPVLQLTFIAPFSVFLVKKIYFKNNT